MEIADNNGGRVVDAFGIPELDFGGNCFLLIHI